MLNIRRDAEDREDHPALRAVPSSSFKDGLPDIGGKWPPEPFDEAARAFKVWDAWYTGDQDELFNYYSSDIAPTRPIQYRSGFRGKVARFFWGRPSQQATKRLHIPAPADLARTSADLLFAQPPRFVFGEDDVSKHREGQDRLEKLLGSPEAAAIMLEAGELQAALGGAYLRLWWDEDFSDKVELAAVAADSAVPEWRYGRLVAVTFWTVVHKEKKGVYRHLERHSPGKIEHGLYFGTDDVLGAKVDPRTIPDTAWVADVAPEGVIDTGVKGLTAAYAPNVRPNRLWRNTPGLSALGRSDFDGLEPLFDALDQSYSSWVRDLDLAKARIFIDENILANQGPGKGASFDLEQEVFTSIRALGKMADGGNIQSTQFSIRWSEHANTAAELLNAILRGAGYSASNFADDTLTVTKTATEIESRDKLSERTRDKKANYWKAALQPLAEAMVQLDHNIFGTNFELKDAPEVRFPIRPQVNPSTQAGTLSSLAASNLISIEQAVRERNPNWSGDDVNDEVKRIKKDLDTGMSGGQPPQEDQKGLEGPPQRPQQQPEQSDEGDE
ncbi:MAG TPA: phage portal protein [Polyangiaceae bacterium]|nr:phage portal protein [Polyangiaceae bacterium]